MLRWPPLLTAALALGLLPGLSRAGLFTTINLVSDVPGVAQVTDPNLVNAWGIGLSGGSPFWISNNGTGTTSLYRVNAQGVVSQVSPPSPVSMPNAAPI